MNAGELVTLINDFEFLFSDLGEPEGMTLFEGETGPNGCTVYFSPPCLPQAPHLIAAYSGTPCEAPHQGNLRYLAGDMRTLGP
jgi:hypothetical protein